MFSFHSNYRIYVSVVLLDIDVQVAIRDVDEAAMELLVDFCYTSTVVVEESNVQTLLPAACLLQLAEIQDVCCEFLQKQLDPSNCLGIRAFADTHACRDLLRKADKYTQQHFTSVIQKALHTCNSSLGHGLSEVALTSIITLVCETCHAIMLMITSTVGVEQSHCATAN